MRVNLLITNIYKIALSHCCFSTGEGLEPTNFTDPFADMYPNGIAPKWPEGFSDRLEVIKFKFVKNATTGQPMLVDDGDSI